MRIKKINIKDFRVFHDTSFELGKNLTCISGHNGVGKSTLLAILGNVGELKKDVGHHLNGNAFRGEFGQIIFGDKKHDTTGEKCTITFENLPTHPSLKDQFTEELSFRSTFQKRVIKKEVRKQITATVAGEKKELTVVNTIEQHSTNDRYRLIPIRTENRKTESKIPWPTYYLGLSRLYPIGEAKDITVANNSSTSNETYIEILKAHAKILSSSYEDYLGSSSVKIKEIKKSGFGIETNSFSAKMNSSGLDNLGQILTSVFSFQLLRDSLKEKYCGGLLLIDEIDATLHPVAQNKLIDFLAEKSNELDLQIVFTTHSISLLEHLAIKNNLHRNSAKILYLTNKRSKLEVKDQPTIDFIRNDLMETYSGAQPSRKISVFTEDDTARWFLNKILSHHEEQVFDLKFINMHVGWTEIIKLIKNDPSYYKNHLVILDPDLNEDSNYRELESHLRGTPYRINNKNSNVFTLPGEQYIEKIFWEFMESLTSDDPFFYHELIEYQAVNRNSLLNHGPFSDQYSNKNSEKEKIKAWFTQNKWICDIAFDYWIKKEDNLESCARFINLFTNSYSIIYHRMR